VNHTAQGRPADERPTISAVIVSYDSSAKDIRAAVDSLLAQSNPPSELVLVDNGPTGELARELRGYAGPLKTIASDSNPGYGAAVNAAAAASSGTYLLCLNPDAQMEPGCLEELAAVADTDERIALVGAQILLGDGVRRNAGDNPLHPSGISVSGGYGESREHGPPRDVAVVSGACCLIRRAALLKLGGFREELFLYYEDVDLAWRANIAGMRVVYCPAAVVTHDYEFGRRKRKWFLLERNRLLCVLSNYEARTLVLLAPLLILTEFGLLTVAVHGGWLKQKLAGYRSLLTMAATLPSRRRAVAATRRHDDAQLLELFDNRLDSALLPGAASVLANIVCVPYLLLVRLLLRGLSTARAGN
jgi:GT2 family glycosyltransferase